jgi:hypothetical protein
MSHAFTALTLLTVAAAPFDVALSAATAYPPSPALLEESSGTCCAPIEGTEPACRLPALYASSAHRQGIAAVEPTCRRGPRTLAESSVSVHRSKTEGIATARARNGGSQLRSFRAYPIQLLLRTWQV